MSKPSAAEMAYGTLWRLDKEPTESSRKARQLLLDEIGKEGKRRAVDWAVETFGAPTRAEIWADAWRGP